VGCRIGGAQVHGLAALHEPQRQGRGDRRLADAALAHHHDQPVPGGGQFVGQRVQAGSVALAR
jgi:hypothetical protein